MGLDEIDDGHNTTRTYAISSKTNPPAQHGSDLSSPPSPGPVSAARDGGNGGRPVATYPGLGRTPPPQRPSGRGRKNGNPRPAAAAATDSFISPSLADASDQPLEMDDPGLTSLARPAGGGGLLVLMRRDKDLEAAAAPAPPRDHAPLGRTATEETLGAEVLLDAALGLEDVTMGLLEAGDPARIPDQGQGANGGQLQQQQGTGTGPESSIPSGAAVGPLLSSRPGPTDAAALFAAAAAAGSPCLAPPLEDTRRASTSAAGVPAGPGFGSPTSGSPRASALPAPGGLLGSPGRTMPVQPSPNNLNHLIRAGTRRAVAAPPMDLSLPPSSAAAAARGRGARSPSRGPGGAPPSLLVDVADSGETRGGAGAGPTGGVALGSPGRSGSISLGGRKPPSSGATAAVPRARGDRPAPGGPVGTLLMRRSMVLLA